MIRDKHFVDNDRLDMRYPKAKKIYDFIKEKIIDTFDAAENKIKEMQ